VKDILSFVDSVYLGVIKHRAFFEKYSSVAFDFAYLKKPVLYFQFDHDEFFSEHCDKGYFDYDVDAFGEVETDVKALVARLREYIESGCQMKPKYVERVEKFFAFTDKNNCKRVYEAILEAAREDALEK
jgi:CDP-glycerol glycerophosphotransferase (TagB/SpsB family)